MAVLQVKNIEKHFGATRVLEDISFELSRAGPSHHRLLPAAERPRCCAA